jgi:adenylate cyclase
LRTRTLFLVAATTLGLVALLYVPLRALLLGSFRELEDRAALQNLERAENALEAQLSQLKATCGDYATWDDSFEYLAGALPDYTTNLVDETFERNRVELIVFLTSEGDVHFSKFYDIQRDAELTALPDLSRMLSRLCQGGSCPERKGFVDTPYGPMMIAVSPVLRSDESGPTNGTLIMGRRLDDAEITALGERTDLALSLSRQRRRTTKRVEVIDDDRIAGLTPLDDVGGAPFLVLRAEMARDVYARGVVGTYVLAVAVAIAGLVFGIVILLLLDRVVLRRIARLSDDVRHVSQSADPGVRVAVEGNDELAGLADRINAMLAELAAAREMIRATFGRYVSEDVARAILSKPEGVELGGETREVTIFFSDLRGYSTISERMAPPDVVELLNEYFGAMSEEIEREGGVVIEFLGDAILAVFGAPGELEGHAAHAVRAALAIERRGVALNRAWDESGQSKLWREHGIGALGSRIGIHTGRVVAGNLGSKRRMKYAVIGDAVNTAARVESLNDVVGTSVLLTREVREQLPAELAERMEDRGEHRVKGREKPVHVYSIAGSA